MKRYYILAAVIGIAATMASLKKPKLGVCSYELQDRLLKK